MIIIAPDKFKGTLTADEAASAIAAQMFPSVDARLWPMADGGEGTAVTIARHLGLERRSFAGKDALLAPREVEYFTDGETAYIDSASTVGIQYLRDKGVVYDPWAASSRALGEAIAFLFESGHSKVVVGIGGTACCDGGEGLLMALPEIPLGKSLEFLADVDVPLLPVEPEGMSALTFMRQKGFSCADEPVMAEKLVRLLHATGGRNDWPFAGSGSGIGYALTLLGGHGMSGARYVLDMYLDSCNDMENVTMFVTGEGRFDCQSLAGKVTGTVMEEAKRWGIGCAVVAGSVDYTGLTVPAGVTVIDLSAGETAGVIPDKAATVQRMNRRRQLLNHPFI
ncbi:MAG: glycerate kinase [Muribaculaceae bacterium]|nr:glycerate kinase [Muribaculaceae bacterium]